MVTGALAGALVGLHSGRVVIVGVDPGGEVVIPSSCPLLTHVQVLHAHASSLLLLVSLCHFYLFDFLFFILLPLLLLLR